MVTLVFALEGKVHVYKKKENDTRATQIGFKLGKKYCPCIVIENYDRLGLGFSSPTERV